MNTAYSNKFASWFTGTVLNKVKHPTYGKHKLTADQIKTSPVEYKNKLFKSIGMAVKNGDITADLIRKHESVNTTKLTGILEAEGPCWKGYEQIGMKMKNGKEVPNCVPKNEVTEASKTMASGEWVAFASTSKGKKLLKTFNTGRGANTWLAKNSDKLLTDPKTRSVGAMTKQEWDEREAKYAIEGINECGCGGGIKLAPIVGDVNESAYKFGEIEYTLKNTTPTDIQDLAFAYNQATLNKIAGKGTDSRIRSTRDLGRLVGKNPMNPTEKSKEPALLLHLYKTKLVNVDEYKELYNDLLMKLKKLSSVIQKGGGIGNNAAAKAAAKADMIEAKKYDIGSGYMGNGLTIWNRAEEEYGDYKQIAHISKEGDLKIYDKQLPNDIRKTFQIWADSMKKGNRGPLV